MRVRGKIDQDGIRVVGRMAGVGHISKLTPYSMAGNRPDICFDCALIAYDQGIGVVDEWDYDLLDRRRYIYTYWAHKIGEQQQIDFMIAMGDVVADHACSAKIDLGIQCDCGCNRR